MNACHRRPALFERDRVRGESGVGWLVAYAPAAQPPSMAPAQSPRPSPPARDHLRGHGRPVRLACLLNFRWPTTRWARAGISGRHDYRLHHHGIAGFLWGAISDRIGARQYVMPRSCSAAASSSEPGAQSPVFQIAYGAFIAAAGARSSPADFDHCGSTRTGLAVAFRIGGRRCGANGAHFPRRDH
jgi:hypothetical protein